MSLRIKLGAAFIIVLLPLLVVLLGGWWRMNIVLDRQQTAFHLSREIEQFFSRVNSEEQLFIATGDLRHSRDVLILFSDLRPLIERFQHFSTENGMLRQGATVIDHFNAFQSGFTGFASQVLDLQTFKSKVERESARLQEVADAVLDREDERLVVIHQEKDRILHAEKNYFLSGDAAAAAEVSSAARSIADLARAVRQSAAESDAALEAFRIARIAGMFEENLLTYIAKKTAARQDSRPTAGRQGGLFPRTAGFHRPGARLRRPARQSAAAADDHQPGRGDAAVRGGHPAGVRRDYRPCQPAEALCAGDRQRQP